VFYAQDYVWGLLVPALIGLLIPWLAGPRRMWTTPLALGGAFLAFYIGRLAWPTFHPIDSLEWLWLIALIATLVGIALSLWRVPVWAAGMVVLAAAVLMLWLLLRPLVPRTLSSSQAFGWFGGIAVAITLVWVILEWGAHRARGASFSLVLFLIAAGGGICLMLSSSQKLGQMPGAMAVALAAMSIVAWRQRQHGFSGGGMAVFVLLLAGPLVYGYFFADLKSITAMLIALSPLAMLLADLPYLKLRPAWRVALRLALVLIPIAIAVSLAAVEFVRRSNEMSEYY
jgi:hypothetical protein